MSDLLVIGVGQQSPFPSAGIGESAVAVHIASGILTAVVQLPAVSAADVDAIHGGPFGLALHQGEQNPIGQILVLLGESEGSVWPLCAPVLDSATYLLDWVERPADGNSLLIVLVDSLTNSVKALRTVGLPMEFLDMLRHGIMSATEIDREAILKDAARVDHVQVWKKGVRWINDAAVGEFVRQ